MFIRSSQGCKQHLIMRVLTQGWKPGHLVQCRRQGSQALSPPWGAVLSTGYSRGSGHKQPRQDPNSIILLDSGQNLFLVRRFENNHNLQNR